MLREWEEPCVCGHLKKDHVEYSNPICIDRCLKCGRENTRWHRFKLDNLKYMEWTHAQKTYERE